MQQDYYILDIHRERLDFPSLRRAVQRLAYAWAADDLLIEDQEQGTALIQMLRHERPDRMPLPIGIRPVGDKQVRLAAVSAPIEQGRVHRPETADFISTFRDELLQFPNGRHDDQVDALTQAILWREKKLRDRGGVQQVSMFGHDRR